MKQNAQQEEQAISKNDNEIKVQKIEELGEDSHLEAGIDMLRGHSYTEDWGDVAINMSAAQSDAESTRKWEEGGMFLDPEDPVPGDKEEYGDQAELEFFLGQL